MTNDEDDPYGTPKKTTQYDGQGRRGARGGKARSAWAVCVAAIFLIAVGAWVLLRSRSATDPAPGGSSGSGVVTTSPPSGSN
jgi:hypothetical protein